MYGNVSEWCEDVYSATYYKESPPADPAGPPNPGKDVKRVIRGGSWLNNASGCRSSGRNAADPAYRNGNVGFRVVLSPVQP